MDESKTATIAGTWTGIHEDGRLKKTEDFDTLRLRDQVDTAHARTRHRGERSDHSKR